MSLKFRQSMFLVAVIFLGLAVIPSAAQPYDPSMFSSLKWRLVGPFRGGRVLAVSGVPGDPLTFYFGGTGSGVWKTTNGGQDWVPCSTGSPCQRLAPLP